MILLKDAGVWFGARALFSEANLVIGERARIGLVGANGTGKTTLFRLLVGERSPDEGSIEMPKNLRIGYLPQEEVVLGSESVFDEAVKAFDHIHEIRLAMHELEAKMQDTSLAPRELEKILSRYSRLQEEYAQDGYTFESRTEEILEGLGFHKNDFNRPCREFSGGYQMRIALARMLLEEPDLLLLDEPTNHLDLPSIEWLEEFIKGFRGALVISSHDRFFLDRVVDNIWDVFNRRITSYKGNYSAFTGQKEFYREQVERQREKVSETREHLQRFIDKFRGYPKKAALVRSRKKMLERLPDVEELPGNQKTISIRFPQSEKISGRVMALEGVSKRFGEHEVFADVNLAVEPGDRIALVGANGEGKTTLLRIIAGELDASSGEVWRSSKLQSAFYTQIVEERLDPSKTVLEELEDAAPWETTPVLRGLAGAFLFSGDDTEKKVAVLSGGEKSRLALARILLSPSNLLLLDEPTNHLDLASRDVLEDAVRQYPGTVVFSSHDRFLIDRIANKVVEIGQGRARLHLGNWTEFEHWRENEKASSARTPSPQPVKKASKEPKKESGKKLPEPRESLDKKTRAKEARMREEEVNRTFAEIESREKEIKNLEKEMSEQKLYSDKNRLVEVTSRHRALRLELERLQEQLEGLLEE
ncbi:ATP-binding cassette domain-containing protein [bacterium]|nr:ATP-binding cassette domain-containing protein [bacterium]